MVEWGFEATDHEIINGGIIMYILIFFITVVLIPATMIASGLRWQNKQPSGINILCRVNNQEMWDYAHKYVGKIWLIEGVPIVVVSLYIFCYSEFPIKVAIYLQIAGLVLPIIPTVVALRKNFGKKGD